MLLKASEPYSLHNPSTCERRVFLRHQGEHEESPGPYEQVLRILGDRHEKSHLETFPTVVDLSKTSPDERERRTQEEVQKGAAVIYQGGLRTKVELKGLECEIVGEPDFLICESGNYVIRDSKMSRRITEKDHPEIFGQLQIYGWLYEQTFGRPPLRVEIHSGTGAIVEISYAGPTVARQLLEAIVSIKQLSKEPYSPVGWSKCGGCGFHKRCWPMAEKARDVAIVNGVDQGLAIGLRQQGIENIEQFLSHFNAASLAEFERPWGKATQRVGSRAASILRMARSMATGQEELIQSPDIPQHANYVMFDLEGLPPHLDELEKIYLWGMQVFGEKAGRYIAAGAAFGESGDRQGWEAFLGQAQTIFGEYGDIPWVHWHQYEKTYLDKYIERFGDRDGIAARVRNNLMDLLPITQASVALPLPSYSRKVVEKYIGFKRTQEEFGGEWSMAKYIEATESDNEKQRVVILDEIEKYNEEDLAATWAMLTWLKGKQR
jgi:predicted RecB family nuclease